MSCKKGNFKKFSKFTGKILCQSLFFDNTAGLFVFPWNHQETIGFLTISGYIEIGMQFPMNFAKFLRAPFLQYQRYAWSIKYTNAGKFFLLFYLCVFMLETALTGVLRSSKKFCKLHRKVLVMEFFCSKAMGVVRASFLSKTIADVFLWVFSNFAKQLFSEHLWTILFLGF